MAGWWFEPLLKNMKVNQDDDSQLNGKINMFQTTNQMVIGGMVYGIAIPTLVDE